MEDIPPSNQNPNPQPHADDPLPPPPTCHSSEPFPSPSVPPDSSTTPAPSSTSSPQTLTVSLPVESSSGLSSSDGGFDRPTFSQLLAGAMAASPLANSSPGILPGPVVAVPCFVGHAGLMDSPQFTGMTHQAVLASVTAQAQMQLQSGFPSPCQNPFLQPTSSPTPSSVSAQQRSSGSDGNVATTDVDQLPVEQKPQSNHIFVKTAASDGYNWRKYGQKQVKSSENSRSYYKCTHATCSAKKKVEHCQDGSIIEVIYQSEHNHDTPQKLKCSKEKGSYVSQSSGPLKNEQGIDLPSPKLKHSEHFQPKTDQNSGIEMSGKLNCSNDSELDSEINTKEDFAKEPDSKRRLCEVPVIYEASLFKAIREAKVVVHSSHDEGPASDGYRWRKYGQKMVKGNLNPRSYYRCTHAGCPVRKHVERAEDAKVITTYEGHHNHDLPPPKSSSDLPSLKSSEKPMQASDSLVKTPSKCKLISHKEVGGESVLELQEEKLLEPETLDGKIAPETGGLKPTKSAKSLLNVGLDSTSEGTNGASSSDNIQRPLFDGSRAAVPVENS